MHHIVLTATNIDYYNENYDRYAQSSLYIDGVLQEQLNYIYSDLAIINLCQQVVFGGDKEGCYSYSCDMKLDNIRFFNRVITADEVLSIFNAKQ